VSPDDPPSRQWEFGASVDLERVLDEHRIEHLPVDKQRTFVLYREAILNLVVIDGTLSAARAGAVECWEFSQRTVDPDPDAVLTAFTAVIIGGD
jgi:hypothetical protein